MENVTKGPWYALTGDNGGIVDQATVLSEHETDGESTFIADTYGIDENVPLEQRKANALLIAEAGTVHHETGLSPRELAERVKELEGALRETTAEVEARAADFLRIADPKYDQVYRSETARMEALIGRARAALAKGGPSS